MTVSQPSYSRSTLANRSFCSDPSPIENGFQNGFGFEHFARNFSSGAGMFPVVGIDSFYRICDFVDGSERQEAFLAAIVFGEAGFLRDDGPAGGEIACAAIAKPAAVEPVILILGDREFGLWNPGVVAGPPRKRM